jgi:hypothetical protein
LLTNNNLRHVRRRPRPTAGQPVHCQRI